MDLFKTKYPKLHDMYIAYINTDEYAQHPLVKYSNENISKVVSAVTENGKSKLEIDDIIVLNAVDNECTGFILGFSYAFNLIKEANILKEIKNVHANP